MKVKAGSFLFIPLTPSNPRVKAAHVLVQPSSTASLVQNPQATVRPYMLGYGGMPNLRDGTASRPVP